MGRLKKLVDAIAGESTGIQSRLLVARIGLKAGLNLGRIDEQSPDDPAIESRIMDACREVLGKEIVL